MFIKRFISIYESSKKTEFFKHRFYFITFNLAKIENWTFTFQTVSLKTTISSEIQNIDQVVGIEVSEERERLSD